MEDYELGYDVDIDQEYTEDDQTYVDESRHLDDSEEAMDISRKLLQDAEVYHEALRDFRDERERNRKYLLGEQWSDTIENPDIPGNYITEEEYIISQGRQPIVNNQIIQVFKNVVGQYHENDHKSAVNSRFRKDAVVGEMLTNALHSAHEIDETNIVDTAAFREFLISACIPYKTGVEYKRERDKNEITSEIALPTRLFFNTDVSDPRLKDLRFIGDFIDTDLNSLLSAFADNEEEREKIKEWYGGLEDRRPNYEERLGSWRLDTQEFYYPINDHLVRVFNIWRLENKNRLFCHDRAEGDYYQHPIPDPEEAQLLVDAENQKRATEWVTQKTEELLAQGVDITQMSKEEAAVYLELDNIPLIECDVQNEDVWVYYWLTPWGHVLSSGDSPYEHQEHPYTLGLYPMIDSEVRSFVHDLIDLQRQINRTLSLQDFIISASAKGVLMVPEDMIPDGMSPADFASVWSKANGMLTYVPSENHDHMPKQFISNTQNVGAQNLMSVYMNLMKEVSGAHEAIQGITPSSGTSGKLYQQMATNSTLSTKDYFTFFFHIRKKRDYKVVKLIQQFWDEPRDVNVAGKEDYKESDRYDPDVAADVPVDMVITKTNNSPIYREEMDKYLIQFWEAQAIDLEMLLSNSSLPFADKLLQQLKARKENQPPIFDIPGTDPQQVQQLMAMAQNPMMANHKDFKPRKAS